MLREGLPNSARQKGGRIRSSYGQDSDGCRSTSSYEVTKHDRIKPCTTGTAVDGSTQGHSEEEVDPKQGSGGRPVAHPVILTVPAVALAAHAALGADVAQRPAVV
jgi:hypothetical protein